MENGQTKIVLMIVNPDILCILLKAFGYHSLLRQEHERCTAAQLHREPIWVCHIAFGRDAQLQWAPKPCQPMQLVLPDTFYHYTYWMELLSNFFSHPLSFKFHLYLTF